MYSVYDYKNTSNINNRNAIALAKLNKLLLENVPQGNKADWLETQPVPSYIPQIQIPSETDSMLESSLINPRCFHP